MQFLSIICFTFQNRLDIQLDRSELAGRSPKSKAIVWAMKKSYACDLCNKAFPKKSSLMHHKRSLHRINFPYKCDRCDKSFELRTNLSIHKDAIHEGVLYTCDICNKTFKYPSNLSRHKRNIHEHHSKICQLCKKVFTKSRDLQIHLYDHLHAFVAFN